MRLGGLVQIVPSCAERFETHPVDSISLIILPVDGWGRVIFSSLFLLGLGGNLCSDSPTALGRLLAASASVSVAD